MKILYLALIAKWFDMTLSREKREEYREPTAYWFSRLCHYKHTDRSHCDECERDSCNDYTHIHFTNGYGKYRPAFLVELNRTRMAEGIKDWGACDGELFVLEQGEIIKKYNIK